MNLTPEFEASCADTSIQNYPINLVYKSASLFKLRSFKTQLDEASAKLFFANDTGTDVRFLDAVPRRGAGVPVGPPSYGSIPEQSSLFQFSPIADFQTYTIDGDSSLRSHLGNTLSTNQQNGTTTGHLATKEDPICRFM